MSARQIRRAHEHQVEREARRVARSRRDKAIVAAGAAVGATVLFAPAAEAATFTVTSLADTDELEGTLREEIEDANQRDGDDTIVFQAGLSGTITLTNGQIRAYADSIDIQGPGPGVITVDADDSSRHFIAYDFDANDDGIRIAGLTLTNGFADDGGVLYTFEDGDFAPDVTIHNAVLTGNVSTSDGGAIRTFYSPVTITDSTISNNKADGKGGGLRLFAADADDSKTEGVVIRNSAITGNETTVVGSDNGEGGGVHLYTAYDDVLIENSTISNNRSTLYGGGITLYDHEPGVTTTIRNSTISGNYAGADGGGVALWDSADDSASFLVENSTVSGNRAHYYGGGIWNINDEDAPRTVRNSTIVGNIADAASSGGDPGGGIYAQLYDETGGTGGEFTLSSTIVANNVPSDLADDEATSTGQFEATFSLIESPRDANLAASATNITGIDPQLGPLADNGGPTQTHAPSFTSAVIDKGVGNGLPIDQRGSARTFDAINVANAAGGDGTDIGSVELLPGGRLSAALAQCKGAVENVLFAPGTAIVGTDANDVIVGTDAADIISSGRGKDKVCAAGGNDAVKAGAGKDNVAGQAGKDRLKGNGGNDKLQGNAGRDTLKGGGGKDTLKGGGGKDKLRGGPGRDKLKGGAGKDSERQ